MQSNNRRAAGCLSAPPPLCVQCRRLHLEAPDSILLSGDRCKVNYEVLRWYRKRLRDWSLFCSLFVLYCCWRVSEGKKAHEKGNQKNAMKSGFLRACEKLRKVSAHIGKDEVGGSNPPSSSRKHRKLRFSMLFCCKTSKMVWVNCLTHTRKWAERAKEYRRGSSAIYQMVFATFNAQYAYSFIF